MRLLVDAQLRRRLARALEDAGHDVLHTSDLPDGNASTDARVCEVADRDGRVVITEDRDLRDSHLLRGSPRRLLIVRTGNASNDALVRLFAVHGAAVVTALQEADFIELGPVALIKHQRR